MTNQPSFSTPMMKQYGEIKKQYPDCLLFYRMGDFYELFMEDAHIGARILNITLTGKSGGKDGKIPMAGVPYHAVDSYLAKLIKAGYKVAICEQLSPPNKKGLVERGVVRVVTPGTLLDEKILEKKDNNYIISILIEKGTLALSFADVSTGQFGTYETPYTDLSHTLTNELAKLSPVECILPEHLYNDPELLKILRTERGLNIFPFFVWDTYADSASSFLKKHFQVATLAGFGIEDTSLTLQTSAALLGYLQETQKTTVSHIKKISRVVTDDHLIMDRSTMINLELFSTIRDHDTRGSLLTVLDHTITPMGGRLLKTWMKKPLIDKKRIEERYDAIGALLEERLLRKTLAELMEQIPDIERIISRLSVNIGNPRDVVNLKQALQLVLEVKETLRLTVLAQRRNDLLLKKLSQNIDAKLLDVVNFIQTHIIDEPPLDTREGGIFRSNIHKELDKLRNIVGGSRSWITELEHTERQKTGISSLKVRFNKVFGFYIEISKANLHLIPDYYDRKQTLVNGERFITPDLKHHEEIILTAEERLKALEYELFVDLLKKILYYTDPIQKAAGSIAVLDCLLNFANLAEKENYVRPTLLYSGEIRITQGRHPVVEKLLAAKQFVPNDLILDNISQQMLLITGPNMAGKSVFIRQVALLVFMAHMGCFVPAQKAHISIVDRIFVRSGASDVITSGLSTFMVEMVETAHILHHATKNSLIVMDEIGRGTSTYDGISIAWAIAEYLITHFSTAPKTLFATHYHELQALEEKYPKHIKNFHMAVAQEQGNPVFLHTILPGGASHSFGIAVAKLAGIPDPVIQNAQEMLGELEKRNTEKQHVPETFELSDSTIADRLIHKELENIDISQLTPLQALNKLAEIKEKLKLFEIQEEFKEID